MDQLLRRSEVAGWPDDRLVAAVRRDPPDPAALDALAARHWQTLLGRCERLTANRDRARDVAQEAWARLLRARGGLRADGNFPAYLATIATNVWRDRYRAARRARGLGEHRVASLDAEVVTGSGEAARLADALADDAAASSAERLLLRLDLERALARLPSRSRDLLLARYVAGESAAELGARYGRTEQTITAWLRRAIDQMRRALGEPAADGRAAAPVRARRGAAWT